VKKNLQLTNCLQFRSQTELNQANTPNLTLFLSLKEDISIIIHYQLWIPSITFICPQKCDHLFFKQIYPPLPNVRRAFIYSAVSKKNTLKLFGEKLIHIFVFHG
jgi:hypothetical protein